MWRAGIELTTLQYVDFGFLQTMSHGLRRLVLMRGVHCAVHTQGRK